MRQSASKYTALAHILPFLFFLDLTSSFALAQFPSIHVGQNVQVSAAHAQLSHAEVLVAADPNDPKRLIGCSMVFAQPGSGRVFDGVSYLSTDGGAHWRPTLYLDRGNISDPSCGFGPDGTALSVFLEDNDGLVYRSGDGGETWKPPVTIDPVDRAYLTIDSTGGKFNGRIYINAEAGTALLEQPTAGPAVFGSAQTGLSLQRSFDGGKTFQPIQKRASPSPRWVVGMGNGVVLSDGTYLSAFGELPDRAGLKEKPPYVAPNAWLKVISSGDGGETLNSPTSVSDWYMNYADVGSTASVMPVIAVDRNPGPFHDRLYIVWPDYRTGRGEILLSYSSNQGRTWSQPRRVNDDRAWASPARGPDDIMPSITVNKNGVVGVVWYDRRDNPYNYGWWVRFAASIDGGETFSPSVRVSAEPARLNLDGEFQLRATAEEGSDLQITVGFRGFDFNGGHTAGITADSDGKFHPLWIDNRTGIAQVWTAAVAVDGTAALNGSSQLAKLEDVSDRVKLNLGSATFDRKTGLIIMDANLQNSSARSLDPPLLVRVLSLDSKLGEPEIDNADNQVRGQGAVVDFSSLIPKGSSGLAPGAVTASKQLRFLLKNTRWQSQPPTPSELKEFLIVQAKALGGKPAERSNGVK